MIRNLTLLAVLIGAGQAAAQNPPPNLVKVESVSAPGKSIKVVQFVGKPVQMAEAYTVDVGGRTEMRTRNVTKMVFEQVIKDLPLANAMAFDVNGKQISQDAMWQRLKAGAVIATTSSMLPEAAYLKALNSDTLVIVLPSIGASPIAPQAAPGAAPAPVAPVSTPGANPVPMPITPIPPKPIPAPIPPMAAARNPAAARQHVLAGRAMLARRQFADAIDHFREASAADPGDPAVLYFLAYAQCENGDSSAADESVRQAVAQERYIGGDPLGFEWERFQGPARVWLSTARARAQTTAARPTAAPSIKPPA